MSSDFLIIAGVLVLLLLSGGAVFTAEQVMPALRARAERKHQLRMAQLDLEQQRLDAKRPLCTSCGHGLGFHDGGMQCRADTEHPVERTDTGTVTLVKVVPCKCTEYTDRTPGLSGSILRELNQ